MYVSPALKVATQLGSSRPKKFSVEVPSLKCSSSSDSAFNSSSESDDDTNEGASEYPASSSGSCSDVTFSLGIGALGLCDLRSSIILIFKLSWSIEEKPHNILHVRKKMNQRSK